MTFVFAFFYVNYPDTKIRLAHRISETDIMSPLHGNISQKLFFYQLMERFSRIFLLGVTQGCSLYERYLCVWNYPTDYL